jgi:hypothetical protein
MVRGQQLLPVQERQLVVRAPVQVLLPAQVPQLARGPLLQLVLVLLALVLQEL